MTNTKMSRRALLRSGLAGTVALAAPTGNALAGLKTRWRNWSGAQQSNPRWVLHPQSVQELATALQVAPAPIRPVGSSHSFSALCAGDGSQIHMGHMTGLISRNEDLDRARFRAGTTINAMGPALAGIGQALQNQGDVDVQTLAGACGTSTHGTGAQLGSFSSMVTAVQLITPAGEQLEFSERENADLLPAVACNLGALGVVTEIELQNRAPYRLREIVETEPLAEVLGRLDRLQSQNRHFEFFVFPYSDTVVVKRLNESTAPVTPAPEWELPQDTIFRALTKLGHGVSPLDGPIQRMLASLTPRSERVGESHQIFPSVRNTRFNEMEYEIPLERGPECLLEVLDAIRKAELNVMFPIEYRNVAADVAWLSPFYRRSCAALSIHQWANADHRPLFALVEPILRRHGGRPHWGKMHGLKAAQLAELYPRWDDFNRLRQSLDPQGRLLNESLRGMLIA